MCYYKEILINHEFSKKKGEDRLYVFVHEMEFYNVYEVLLSQQTCNEKFTVIWESSYDMINIYLAHNLFAH